MRGLFNHDPNLLLGRTSAGTMKLSVDSRGLVYDISAADTTAAKDVLKHLQRGDLTGSSFSFIPGVENVTSMMRDGRRIQVIEVKSVKGLFDVGPVTFPAYSTTTAAARGLTSARYDRYSPAAMAARASCRDRRGRGARRDPARDRCRRAAAGSPSASGVVIIRPAQWRLAQGL